MLPSITSHSPRFGETKCDHLTNFWPKGCEYKSSLPLFGDIFAQRGHWLLACCNVVMGVGDREVPLDLDMEAAS